MDEDEFEAAAFADELAASFPDASADGAVVVAIGAVDARGRTSTATRGAGPPDATFEIGSITKTLTGTLLASLVLDGVVGLDDDVATWLPTAAGKGITPLALATHTAGLPRLGRGNVVRAVMRRRNPYVGYGARQAERDLRGATRGARQVEHLYSNFGYQLLGLLLERASGQPYEQLLARRITAPLGMTRTGVGPAGGASVPGHANGRPVPHWDMALLPGAGGVSSTIADMTRYLAACARPARDTALGAAIRFAQESRLSVAENRQVGLGWFRPRGRVLWHNGRTGGFCASIAIDPDSGHAVVLLANSTSGAGDDLDQRVITIANGRR